MLLRDYQEEAVSRTFNWLMATSCNPMVVVPTGGGKSLIIAELMRRLRLQQPSSRIILATHVRELIEQNYAEIKAQWPDAPLGICSAGMGETNVKAEITLGTVQTLYTRAWAFPKTSYIFIDEAQMISRRKRSRYQKLFATINERVGRRVPLVGLTATPYRMDSGFLHHGEGAMFDVISANVPLSRLIPHYLCALDNQRGSVEIDTTHMRTVGDDFDVASMEAEVMRQGMTSHALDEIIIRGAERRSWLLFAVSIRHAQMITDYLNARGVSACTLSHRLSKAERDEIVGGFRAGDFRALVSVNIVSVGFNAPRIDLLGLIRPTISTGLYVQMLGRGMRKAEGKSNCLVLDYGGNIKRHGPINDPRVREPSVLDGKRKLPLAKTCPDCAAEIGVFFRNCPGCGHLFSQVEGVADRTNLPLDFERGPPEQALTPREIIRQRGAARINSGRLRPSERVENDPFLAYLNELRNQQ